jgi:hypothetical protein
LVPTGIANSTCPLEFVKSVPVLSASAKAVLEIILVPASFTIATDLFTAIAPFFLTLKVEVVGTDRLIVLGVDAEKFPER